MNLIKIDVEGMELDVLLVLLSPRLFRFTNGRANLRATPAVANLLTVALHACHRSHVVLTHC